MADEPKLPVQIDVGARVEAKLEVKTEIPSESSGRLVDALTDLIRPFSESRGLRADLLRLQRAEVAIEIARRARERLEVERLSVGPLPTKILVPLIEKGSCEAPDDDEMIDRWANLLAAASANISVQPRYVGILGELAGSQADCLEHIAFSQAEHSEFPHRDFLDVAFNYPEHVTEAQLRKLLREVETVEDIEGENFERLVAFFISPGVFIELIMADAEEMDFHEAYDTVRKTGIRRDDDLAILESLGLIRRVVLSDGSVLASGDYLSVYIIYCHLTPLGVAFCEVCAPAAVKKLERIDEEVRQKKAAAE